MSNKGKFKTHCKRGHARTPENVNKHGACIECGKELQKEYRAENSENTKQYMKKYMKKYYSDNRDTQLRVSKESYASDPEFRSRAIARSRKASLKKIGWTPESVEEAKVKQENRCAICNKVFESTPHADHNHKTKTPRGLLCGTHNQAIGLLQDSPELCDAAAAYLRKWEK